MAKAATKKKPAKKKAPKGVTMGNTDVNPDQGQLEGMEEERIPEIETAVSSIIAAGQNKKDLESRISEQVDELAGLLHEHGLTEYRCCGRLVSLEPGEERVKIKKAKKTKHDA